MEAFKVEGSISEFNLARLMTWGGGEFAMLDFPLMWQLSEPEVMDVLMGIQLDDGTQLYDWRNTVWRKANIVQSMTMMIQAMLDAYGPPKRDLLETWTPQKEDYSDVSHRAGRKPQKEGEA